MKHQDPLDQQIARTLNTVAQQVPVRDRLAELTAGVERPTVRRWRFSQMPALAGVVAFVAGLAIVGGGLLALRNNTNEPSDPAVPVVTTSTTTVEVTLESIEGIWVLESFSIAGDKQSVEVGVNTAQQPWVEIGESRIAGNLGCNRFDAGHREPPTMAAGLLTVGGVSRSAALCGDGPGGVMAVETVFIEMMTDENSRITVAMTDGDMTWSSGETVLSFVWADEDSIPTSLETTEQTSTTLTVTTYLPSPVLDIRTESGVPGDELVICGTRQGADWVRVTFSDPVSGEVWPDEIDEFVEPDETGRWCWSGVFPDQLQSTEPTVRGERRIITPGVYQIRLESFGDILAYGSVEVLPGYPTVDTPSQTASEAVRDEVFRAVAELPVGVRVETLVWAAAPEGIWVLSRPGSLETHLLTGSCEPDAEGCVYGRDWVNVADYGELLLMDPTGREVLRAFPMPGLVPSWLYVGDEAVYAGRIGDGALPDASVVRIDRVTLEASGLVFPAPETGGTLVVEAIAAGEWLDGWSLDDGSASGEPVVTMTRNKVGLVETLSWIGDVFIDPDGVAALFPNG